MSVINQMLKDLERQEQGMKAGPLPLEAPIVDEPPNRRKKIIWLGLGLVLLLAAYWWVRWSGSVPVHAALPETAAPQVEARVPNNAAPRRHAPRAEPVINDAMASGPEKAQTKPALPSEPPLSHWVKHSTGGQFEQVALSNEKANHEARVSKDGPIISEPHRPLDKRAITDRKENAEHNRRETLSASDTPAVTINKSASRTTQAEMLWRRARINPDRQEALLREALQLKPDLLGARIELVAYLVAHQRLDEAEAVVDEGLSIVPSAAVLREWKARFLMGRGDVQNAWKWLAASMPQPFAEYISFYGLKAALAARLEKPALAASLYQKLVEVQPKEARWWLGLGLAHERLQQSRAAIQAYEKALAAQGLTPKSRAFVLQQLARLQQTGTH
ncbi:MAG: tetratricopeptide repeat protein [Gammaproteobacteria bacterium]|nr:MAG: tetratricopeptide repeat protein [Gammaproteobacteria bacterium]